MAARKRKTQAQRTRAAYAKAGKQLKASEKRANVRADRRAKAAYKHEAGKLRRSERRRLRFEKRRQRKLARKFKILQDTGRLAGSIRSDIGTDYVEAYTDVSYAVFHTSDAPRTKIPLRDFFDVDQEVVLGEMTDLILANITSGL